MGRSTSIRTTVIFACHVCASFTMMAIQYVIADTDVNPTKAYKQPWVAQAEKMIKDLVEVASTTQSNDSRFPFTKDLDCRRKAESVLWRLWLHTGMAPLVKNSNEPLHMFWERNASAYKQYVNNHAHMNLENLTALGLTNAVESFGSPWWYMTLTYLEEKACLVTEIHFIIHTNPSHPMVESLLSKQAYHRLSEALSRWLEMNRSQMVWDPDAKRFRAKEGKYAGTDDLLLTTMIESSPPDEADRIRSEKSRKTEGLKD